MIIVITGPTAAGKTALALAVAPALGAEVISADSRQVYRYLDIGTAKPPLEQRARVPHHALDLVYPDQPFTVVDYGEAANRALDDVLARGRVALVVGGSPHYLSALMDRLEPPPVNRRLRRWLEAADARSPGLAERWLRTLDPRSAGRIDPRNRRRVIRALEATLTAGRPFSVAGRRRESRSALWVGLRLDRAELHQRVRARTQAMLAAGWLSEVRVLLAMGYSPELPAFSATGYRELAQVARGQASLEEAGGRVIAATNAFIRRQEGWLRREARIHWLDAADPGLAGAFLRLAETAA